MMPEDWRQELLADQKQEELYEYQMRTDEEFFLSEIDNEIEAYKKAKLALKSKLNHYGWDFDLNFL